MAMTFGEGYCWIYSWKGMVSCMRWAVRMEKSMMNFKMEDNLDNWFNFITIFKEPFIIIINNLVQNHPYYRLSFTQ